MDLKSTINARPADSAGRVAVGAESLYIPLTMPITKDITIEELVEQVPESVKYLLKQGIVCILCGEPIWGTLEEAAKSKGFGDVDIDRFVDELNALAHS